MSLYQQGVDSFKVEFGFGASATDYVFTRTDVTQYVRSVSITRGKTDDFQDFSAGQALIVLDNRTRLFDPTYTSGAYYGLLLPRTRVIVTLIDNLSNETVLFNGFAGGYPQTYGEYGADATVEVPCYDILALTSQIETPTDPSQAVISSYATSNSRFYRFGDFTESGDVVYDSNSRNNAFNVQVSTFGQPLGPELAPFLNRSSSYFGNNGGLPALDPTIVRSVATFAAGHRSILFGGWVQVDVINPIYSGSGVNSFMSVGYNDSGIGVEEYGIQLDVDKLYGGVIVVSSAQAISIGFELFRGTTDICDGQPHHIVVHYNTSGRVVTVCIDGVIETGTTTAAPVGGIRTNDLVFSWSAKWSYYIQDWFFYLNGEPVISQFVADPEYYAGIFYGVGSNVATMTTYERFDLVVALTGLSIADWVSTETSSDYQGECAEFNIAARSLLQVLQDIARTEQGFLFSDREGKIRFLPRYYVAETVLSSPAMTFTDDPAKFPTSLTDIDGSLYTAYREFGFDYDDAQLANVNQVVIGNGDSGSYEDATSTAALGKKSNSINTLLSRIPDAQNMAEGLTNIYKDIKLRLKELQVFPLNNYQAYALANLDIADLVVTERTPMGIGNTITESLTVLQIRHELTPESWNLFVYASARPVNSFFVLDSSSLDGPDILGF